MTLTRGAATLALDPTWVTLLSEAGIIDPYAKPPDLERWHRRALRKAGLEKAEDDPEGFQRVLHELTERDRSVASPYGVALFKLSTPEGWIVSDEEAARIVDALTSTPEAAPLVDFARGGAFEVR